MAEKNHAPLVANHEFKIQLAAGGKGSTGIAKAHIWSDTERKKRALRGLGVTWGLAIFSIFLPLVHFVLVPAFFLAGPCVFFWLKKHQGRIIAVQAHCPFCDKLLQASLTHIEWPQRIVCGVCSEPVRVDLV